MDNKECVVCGTEIDSGKVCDKEICRERYNKIQKTKSKNQGVIYNITYEERENLLKRKNTAVEYKWTDESKSICLSERVMNALEIIDNQTRLESDDVITHGPFAIKFKLKDGMDAITIPDIFIKKYNLIITVKDDISLNNIEEYRVIMNKYSYNYVQLSNKEDINNLEHTLKKVERAIESDNRYITPPKVMGKMVSESKVRSMNPNGLDLKYVLLVSWQNKIVGAVLSKDVLLTDEVYHIDGEDLYVSKINKELKNNSLVIDLKEYDINLLDVKEYLDLMGNPTMVDIISYHLGIPLEYSLDEKINEIMNEFGGEENLISYKEYAEEFDNMLNDLTKETDSLTIGKSDGKLKIKIGGEVNWEIED